MMIMIILPITCCIVITVFFPDIFRFLFPKFSQNKALENIQDYTELEKLLLLQKATLESTRDGILIVDNNNKIIGFNQSFIKIWGIPEKILKSGNLKQALRIAVKKLENPRHFLRKLREINHKTDTQINEHIIFRDGRIFHHSQQIQTLGKNNIGRVWCFQDITAEKIASATIKYHALYDILTNLPNRILFKNLLIKYLEKNNHKSGIALCFLDLDRFKKINDSLGHTIGDKLIQIVANRLQECLRPGDIIARWGGDEFSIILSDISEFNDVSLIQERIFSAFKKGFEIDHHRINLSVSIGIALYPQHGKDAENLIKNADAALSRVKLQGRNHYKIYHPTINSRATELFILENNLYHALEREEFKVYYQPQVNSVSGEITKMEALLRWQHPELGLISPNTFIPIAEETGLILPISEWVLKTACLQNKAWQQNLNLPSLSIAVNFSSRQFQQTNLVKSIEQVLAETKLEHQYLELEITETVAMQDVEFTKKVLKQLQQTGVNISIDDFGTGYSSLSYLKDFPINSIKIDQSFIRDMTISKNHTAITTAIISLAHGLNLAVVAEGVETEEQFNLLRILKCEIMQGYLFSHPLSAEEATRMLTIYKPYQIKSSCLVA